MKLNLPHPPGLSRVCGKSIVAGFDGASMSSDSGLLALREVEQRLGIPSRLAACISDPRAPERVRHELDEIIRIRMLMIAAGYEDGNDADSLRSDPMFKMAMGRLPDDADLCSQPTISRLENLPDARAFLTHLIHRIAGIRKRARPNRLESLKDWVLTPLSSPGQNLPFPPMTTIR